MEGKLSKIPLSELLKMNPENPSLCENEYGSNIIKQLKDQWRMQNE